MNPNAIEVVNDTEIYCESVVTTIEVTQVPEYLLWTELACLLLVVVFGLGLYGRKRQPCVLLLPLAALLFAMPMSWLLSSLPAVATTYAASKAITAHSHQLWLRPVGALLLAVYALIQWRGSPRR